MTRNSRRARQATPASAPVRLVLAAMFVLVVAAAACSTTEGFGKDVKDLGGGIEKSAADNK